MADFLDDKRREIAARLNELRPLVHEYRRLEAAAGALGSVPGASATATAPRRTTRRAVAASSPRRAAATAKPRGRPKGSGPRATQALQLVEAHPGITIPEIAEKMDIQQNYLYRVLPGLAQEGLVEKQGRGWHPKDTA
ncbi:MAG: Rrf2 family transcriptional regulator [Actinobacteria bacterium]|nr:Rrf2 family transcriptional regulator [Actinomycetota bacterium]